MNYSELRMANLGMVGNSVVEDIINNMRWGMTKRQFSKAMEEQVSELDQQKVADAMCSPFWHRKEVA